MVLILIEGTYTLRVNNQNLILFFTFSDCHRLIPNPESLQSLNYEMVYLPLCMD